MKIRKDVIAVGLAALALTACQSGKTTVSGNYLLTEMNGKPFVNNEESKPFISFQKGKISTSVGCNSIFAMYDEGKDSELNIQLGGCTRMFCPPYLREDEYLATLGRIKAWRAEGNVMVWLDEKGNVLLKGKKK